jgi:hypothetical protein
MTDRIHPSMHRVEASAPNPGIDCKVGEARLEQLSSADDAVLHLRQPGNEVVG